MPYRPPTLAVGSGDIYRLLKPYLTVRFFDQFKAVTPLAIYLVLFQLFILRQSIVGASIITGGLVAVIFGLMLFMEGLKVGLMPFGESLGVSLPAKASLGVVLLVVFLLGIGVTFAEPAGALATCDINIMHANINEGYDSNAGHGRRILVFQIEFRG